MGIDIGADAIDRTYVANNAVYSPCYINGVNPAIVAGRIKLVRFYYKGVPAGYSVVGTFYRTNGNILTSRDYENVATVSGLNERVVDIRVEIGDYIGIRILRAATGNGIALDYDAGWVNDYWRTLAETNFPYTNYAFDNLGKRIVSLYGEIATIPTVTTDPATEVEATTATLKGTLEGDGGEACDVRFQYGETIDYGINTDWQSGLESVVAFEQAIIGLDPNKTYHFRAQARNSVGTVNGADSTFTTLVTIPTVTTNPASALLAISAALNGTLDADGGEACDCGFEWGPDISYDYSTSTKSKTTGQTFSEVISGLEPGTIYHFRAFATNSKGTDYGADETFATVLVISRAFALARSEL